MALFPGFIPLGLTVIQRGHPWNLALAKRQLMEQQDVSLSLECLGCSLRTCEQSPCGEKSQR